MLKGLVSDSLVYGAANAVQKLIPFFIIPIITTYLGQEALKLYDVSFTYAYVFSWVIIMGQDASASILYFDEKIYRFEKRQVTAYSLFIQLILMAVFFCFIIPFSGIWSTWLFPNDKRIAGWWTKALFILPGFVLLNQSLNILLWQKRKTAYISLCLVQTIASLVSVFVSVIIYKGGIPWLFYSVIGSTLITGLTGLFMIRREVFVGPFAFNRLLIKRLLIIGLPFAFISFFHQLLPSIDRYFLLRLGYGQELAPYILAVKLGSLLNFAFSAFILAFTPYSMARLNQDDAEKEIGTLFRFVSVAAFLMVPLLLLFRNLLIQIFADTSYAFSANLLPFFFYGWVFDLFSYFSMLGIYRSQRSYLLLVFFGIGIIVSSLLNLLLIPVWGLYGGAIGFLASKILLFIIPLFWLRSVFHLMINWPLFLAFFLASLFSCYLVYSLPPLAGILVVFILLFLAVLYFRKNMDLLLPIAVKVSREEN